jgi:hypothetical protein
MVGEIDQQKFGRSAGEKNPSGGAENAVVELAAEEKCEGSTGEEGV